MKKIITILVTFICVVSSMSLVLANDAIDGIKDVTVHNDEETGYIEINYDKSEVSMQSSRKLLEDLRNIEVGVEKIVETYPDGSTLSVIAEEATELPQLSRGWSGTLSQPFLYKYTDYNGYSRDAFRVSLECDYYQDGWDGYIASLRGTYTVYAIANFSLNWIGKESTQYLHTLILSVNQYGYGNSHIAFSGIYDPFGTYGSVSFTQRMYY